MARWAAVNVGLTRAFPLEGTPFLFSCLSHQRSHPLDAYERRGLQGLRPTALRAEGLSLRDECRALNGGL
jgi:hypothetical protein